MTQLESDILQYEEDFFSAEFCNSIDNIENRLCLDFYEYGKSGEIHRRDDIINFLLNMKQNRDIGIHNFSVTVLNENVLIAHYVSHEKVTNQYALRTSVWMKEEELWRMFFHQGTSCSYPFTI